MLSGLVERSWSTEQRGNFPAFSFVFNVERGAVLPENILSVFVDESGDFGRYEHHAPYCHAQDVLGIIKGFF